VSNDSGDADDSSSRGARARHKRIVVAALVVLALALPIASWWLASAHEPPSTYTATRWCNIPAGGRSATCAPFEAGTEELCRIHQVDQIEYVSNTERRTDLTALSLPGYTGEPARSYDMSSEVVPCREPSAPARPPVGGMSTLDR
jgi:hypothetical protein